MEYIEIELDQKRVIIAFHSSFLRGITDVQVFTGNRQAFFLSRADAKVKSATPPIPARIRWAALKGAIRLSNRAKRIFQEPTADGVNN